MFDTKDPDSYYSEAVKDAVINNGNRQSNNTIILISGLFVLFLASFFGYKFLISSDQKPETKVLGVVHMAQKDDGINGGEIDFTSEIEKIDKETSDSEYSSQLEAYISQEIEQKSSKTDSSNHSTNGDEFTIIVKKGDTLASLAKKYYNDPRAYELIIENNKEAFQKSRTIYPGQELKISHRY